VCFACRVVARRLGLPLVPVEPARLCPLPSTLYSVLLRYKESAVAEERQHLGAVVRALCHHFLTGAGARLRGAAGGNLQLVVPVPSTARPGLPPLARVEGLAPVVTAAARGAAWAPSALQRGRPPRGAAPVLAHMRPDARGFVVRDDAVVRDRRVLVLDDLYVSGARAQSAAAALRLAGARSVVVAVLGRVLRPDRVAEHRAFLGRQTRAEGETGSSAGTGQLPGSWLAIEAPSWSASATATTHCS
jgi:adenine/guanine phosphoribosyltransferase-like PRPP-binding protein